MITDARGYPLTVKLTEDNRHDGSELLPLVESIPKIAGFGGRPLQRPKCIQGDRADDSQTLRKVLHKLGIKTVLD